ncbi:unnamed protein product [Amoebophrya sp. A120]|nr:unnamed protein product [Amoebophrya sp. A120]|eukprot:GSA120T00022382001.1
MKKKQPPILVQNRGKCKVQQQPDGKWKAWVRITRAATSSTPANSQNPANPKSTKSASTTNTDPAPPSKTNTGFIKRQMLVDTGAKRTVLSPVDAFEVLKLKPLEGKTVTVKTTDGKSQRELARVRIEELSAFGSNSSSNFPTNSPSWTSPASSAASVIPRNGSFNGEQQAVLAAGGGPGTGTGQQLQQQPQSPHTCVVELTCSIRTGLLENHGILGRDWISIAQPAWCYYANQVGGVVKDRKTQAAPSNVVTTSSSGMLNYAVNGASASSKVGATASKKKAAGTTATAGPAVPVFLPTSAPLDDFEEEFQIEANEDDLSESGQVFLHGDRGGPRVLYSDVDDDENNEGGASSSSDDEQRQRARLDTEDLVELRQDEELRHDLRSLTLRGDEQY